MPKQTRIYNTDPAQLDIDFGPFHNYSLFSNHWLRKRLPLEPEWEEYRGQAWEALKEILKLWDKEKNRVQKYKDERALENAFIQPIFKALGWEYIYQTTIRSRHPDYALFADNESYDAALGVGREVPDFWKFPKLLADAKGWEIKLDRPIRVKNTKEYPPEQIEWYLNNSGKDYGILTNGKQWRLIPRQYASDQSRFQTYLEFNLVDFINEWYQLSHIYQTDPHHQWFDKFLIFYLFFGRVAYQPIAGRDLLINRARIGSGEYRLGIGKDIKERVFDALRISIEGFLRYEPNSLTAEDLSLCREHSFIFLYRLLFVMFAEDRQLLPFRTNKLYTEKSLGLSRDIIAKRLDDISAGYVPDYSGETTEIWDDLTVLFDLIDTGKKMYGVPAYNGGLFNPDQNRFLSVMKMSDRYLSRVIDHLGRARDEKNPSAGLYRVDYRDLQIQHLGNIYEGLLELHPHLAEEDLIVLRRKSTYEEIVVSRDFPIPKGYEKTDVVYKPGDIHLITDKGERRTSGSYYTPDNIVDYIVKNTLGPLCKQISDQLTAEIEEHEGRLIDAQGKEKKQIEETLNKLKVEYDDRVLRLRVLDPAMGSGHFLLRACQYLAEEIATHPYTADTDYEEGKGDESSITFWKRRVVEKCLYGIDKNSLAVELAKLALWLETVSTEHPLTFLDHHLREGNSLVGAKVVDLGVLPDTGEMFEYALKKQWKKIVPTFIEPLNGIGEIPSNTTTQVKRKDDLYRKVFRKTIVPFIEMSNLWCSTFYSEPGDHPTPEQYEKALKTLTSPKKFSELRAEPWFQKGIEIASREDTMFFHWGFEFPDVFFGGRDGFDAIIGNPPYDVISEKETGHNVDNFKKFIEYMESYEPSRRGKNNLFKLFICKALELLAENGRMGYIVPMALLGDDQSVEIRRELLNKGAFTSIEVFPQKDDPKNRVFEEAKLSTTVFTFVKTQNEELKQQSFSSRVHPGRVILEDSPALKLSTEEIPYYDSSNISVVSCSQEDWDIAVRIMQTERLTRLGALCKSFQGEVNETNERANLSSLPENGPLVLRGSNVCLYLVREASQGEDLCLNKEGFLKGKSEGSKAYHFNQTRVGFQRSSPQNNFRRIIAALIEPDNFCFDTVSYVTGDSSKLNLLFLLALLNSNLLDWYFRLGSTNSKVNEYQFNNLPCPVFSNEPINDDIFKEAKRALDKAEMDKALTIITPLLQNAPFNTAIMEIVAGAVNHIIEIEKNRGHISRNERSALATAAQPYQDFIDNILFAMAEITPEEKEGIEERLRTML